VSFIANLPATYLQLVGLLQNGRSYYQEQNLIKHMFCHENCLSWNPDVTEAHYIPSSYQFIFLAGQMDCSTEQYSGSGHISQGVTVLQLHQEERPARMLLDWGQLPDTWSCWWVD
jgi:hypothetical protein